jgi:hypothetical protein
MEFSLNCFISYETDFFLKKNYNPTHLSKRVRPSNPGAEPASQVGGAKLKKKVLGGPKFGKIIKIGVNF